MIRLEQVRAEMIERFERIDRRLAQYDQRLARIEQRGTELADALEAVRADLADGPDALEWDDADAVWGERGGESDGTRTGADRNGSDDATCCLAEPRQ